MTAPGFKGKSCKTSSRKTGICSNANRLSPLELRVFHLRISSVQGFPSLTSIDFWKFVKLFPFSFGPNLDIVSAADEEDFILLFDLAFFAKFGRNDQSALTVKLQICSGRSEEQSRVLLSAKIEPFILSKIGHKFCPSVGRIEDKITQRPLSKDEILSEGISLFFTKKKATLIVQDGLIGADQVETGDQFVRLDHGLGSFGSKGAGPSPIRGPRPG